MDVKENLNFVFAFIRVDSRLKIRKSKILPSLGNKKGGVHREVSPFFATKYVLAKLFFHTLLFTVCRKAQNTGSTLFLGPTHDARSEPRRLIFLLC